MSFLGDIFGGFTPFDHATAQQHYENVYNETPRHQSSLSHEVIAGAAGFAAMHAYEAHLRASGQPVSHGTMKEILAAIAAAEVDKLAETKGLDWLDRHKAKKMAAHQAHALAAQRYGEGSSGWEYAQSAGGPAYNYNYENGPPYGYPGGPGYGQFSGGSYGSSYSGPGRSYEGYYEQNQSTQYYPPAPPPQQPAYGYEGGYGGGGYEGGYERPPPGPPPGQYYEGPYGQPPPQRGYYGDGGY
ncbi:hypothetical protein OF83DRAFT_1168150 [Amylostereum chailletii]|nr:hypothetical protein OF83DRAFT_1168150 [Amylostereum chailletii]